MSTVKRVLLIALTLLLAFSGLVVPTMAQDGSAWIRFVHAIPGASGVDIYTDGQLTIRGLSYGNATNYITVASGAHHLSVTQSGNTDPIWEQDIEPSAGAALTLVASSAANAAFQVYVDDLNPLALGKARFTAVHTVSDVAAVDVILADGRPVIPGLQLNQPYGTLDLPTASYDLAVVPQGGGLSEALVEAQPFRLNSGTSYTALVYGTADAPDVLLLSAPTRPETSGGGFARIAHATSGIAPVDVYVNNTLIAPGLAFGESTGYIALPAGTHNVSVRGAGTEGDLSTGTLEVSANSYSTTLVAGSAEAPEVQVFEDGVNAVNETTSIFTLFNATTDAAVSAAYSDGSALLGDVAAGESDSALLEPSEQGITVTDGSEETALNLPNGIYGGVSYGAVAVSDGTSVQFVELPPVSLAQGVGSAPGAQALATPEPTPEPTLEPTVAQPTPAPTEAAAAPTSAPEVVAQPTTAAATSGPTARVMLDPGVNLQLRQFPNREALSLGLAPSGTILALNGRVGEPVPPVGTTATPIPPDAEATPFVDPVTLLEEGTDLVPAETWLNVTFDTPDGGSITAWVNALYLSVRDAQGRVMRLRDLPTVPANRAGTTQNTAVEPPTARQNVTMVTVTNLDPGVNIHLRRLPSTDGESLALVGSGTQLQLIGVTEERDWVFASLTTDSGSINGWIASEFVTLARNGQPVTYDRLQELNELTVMPEGTRGGVVSGTAPTSAVAQDLRNVVVGTVIGLNPDANVHLRRNYNVQAESLALLSNNTAVVVTGRSPDDLWLQANYQNRTGWVSSEFIFLTFNGLPYEMENLPIIDTSTPTPTPTETPES